MGRAARPGLRPGNHWARGARITHDNAGGRIGCLHDVETGAARHAVPVATIARLALATAAQLEGCRQMPLRVDRRRVLIGTAATVAAGPAAIVRFGTATAQDGDAVTVAASGLTNPRGFVWAADGTMFIGLGGDGVVVTEATPDASAGVNAEGTPEVTGAGSIMTGTLTAGVARITDGCPTMVATGFPSGGVPDLGWVFGLDDVAILDDQLYGLLAGGGEAYGNPDFPNGVYQINSDGSYVLIADTSAWVRENPVETPHDPVSPDAEPFSLIAGDGVLWMSEANHEQVLTVTPDGTITRIADLSPVGNVAPTGILLAPEGGVYVSFLSSLPFTDGSAKVIHVSAEGEVSDVWTGLTAVTAISLDADGTLLALEMATGNLPDPPFVNAGTGKVVRQTGPDTAEELVTGLDFPVKMGFGPDGALYVSQPAFGAMHGEGQVLRIDLTATTPIVIEGPLEPAVSCQM